MSDGWIKLYRKSIDSGLMQNPELWTFWCWCLLKASHKTKKQMVGMQMVDLKPGQLVFGRKAAAHELCLTERKIRTIVQKLKNLENLTIKTTNKFSIISIANWNSYQQETSECDQQSDQHVTSKRPASDHKQESKKERITTLSPEVSDFVAAFVGYVEQHKGNKAPSQTKSLITKSEDAVDKLMRLDGFSLGYIKSVTRWALQDEFYSTNFFSLAPLREKSKNGATKFANMATKYDQANGGQCDGQERTPDEIRRAYGLC